jgi:hypothetical protein
VNFFFASQITDESNLTLEEHLRYILPNEVPWYFYLRKNAGIFENLLVADAKLFADLGILPDYLRPQYWPKYSI